MKITVLTAALLASGFMMSAHAVELTITGFGSSDKNPFNLSDDLEGQWQGRGTQTTTAIDLTNVSNESDSDSNGFFSDLTADNRSPVVIGTNTAQLILTATLTSAVPGVNEFAITLFDAAGDSLGYTFNWSSFSSGGADGNAVIADLSDQSGTFDGTVASYALSLFDNQGIAPTTLSVDFFDLGEVNEAAVPEPSACALLLLGAGGVAFARRTRVLSNARL